MLKATGLNWQPLGYHVSGFFIGEYFTDAFRNTIVIVLPIILLFLNGYPNAAMGVGVGALLISLTDLPGNRTSKFRIAVLSNLIFFFTALVISFSMGHPWLMAIIFFLLTFLLSMLSVFGNKVALTGTMAIVLSTFILGLSPQDPLLFSCQIFIGGTWYYLVSLIQIRLWPYKYLNHAIRECLLSTSHFLTAKAKCYDTKIPLDSCYQRTISLHIKVNEKQELVRELLLSDKHTMDPSNLKGQRLLAVAQKVIALYEQVTAIHYDYEIIRAALMPTGSLVIITRLIEVLAEEIRRLSDGIRQHDRNAPQLKTNPEFTALFANLHKISQSEEKAAAEILIRIATNIADIEAQLRDINDPGGLPENDLGSSITGENYQAFLPQKPLSFGALKEQFSLKSTAFRFSLRLSVCFFIAYLLTLPFPSEKYSYWMLLTIVIVARPRFGLTWKRNKERILGTLTGAFAGLLLLSVVEQPLVLIAISTLLLLSFFMFNRVKYAISVMSITPAVIICLSLYHGHPGVIFSERIYYTIGGCLIAFSALYLFPVWQADQLRSEVNKMIHANFKFMEEVMNSAKGLRNMGSSRLARKNAHLVLAGFSEAFQFMHLEPGAKKIDIETIKIVQNLNYRINAVITSIYLSEELVLQQQGSMRLAEQVLDELRSCVCSNGSELFPSIRNASNVLEFEGTALPQLKLLLVLSERLSASVHQLKKI